MNKWRIKRALSDALDPVRAMLGYQTNKQRQAIKLETAKLRRALHENPSYRSTLPYGFESSAIPHSLQDGQDQQFVRNYQRTRRAILSKYYNKDQIKAEMRQRELQATHHRSKSVAPPISSYPSLDELPLLEEVAIDVPVGNDVPAYQEAPRSMPSEISLSEEQTAVLNTWLRQYEKSLRVIAKSSPPVAVVTKHAIAEALDVIERKLYTTLDEAGVSVIAAKPRIHALNAQYDVHALRTISTDNQGSTLHEIANTASKPSARTPFVVASTLLALTLANPSSAQNEPTPQTQVSTQATHTITVKKGDTFSALVREHGNARVPYTVVVKEICEAHTPPNKRFCATNGDYLRIGDTLTLPQPQSPVAASALANVTPAQPPMPTVASSVEYAQDEEKPSPVPFGAALTTLVAAGAYRRRHQKQFEPKNTYTVLISDGTLRYIPKTAATVSVDALANEQIVEELQKLQLPVSEARPRITRNSLATASLASALFAAPTVRYEADALPSVTQTTNPSYSTKQSRAQRRREVNDLRNYGFSAREVADMQDVSRSTVYRDIRYAKSWRGRIG